MCPATLDLTAFVLSYNRPEYLREMLQSIIAQSSPACRVIVLDNGSDLPVKEAIEDLLHEGIEWIGADSNKPATWNFERAYALPETKYFTVLHDDDRILPDFFAKTVVAMEKDNKLIAVGTNGLFIDHDGKRTGSRIRAKEASDRIVFSDRREFARMITTSYFPFPTVVYRNGPHRSVRIKEEFGKMWDCIYLCDLAGMGGIMLLDEDLIEYRVHGGQDSQTFPEKMYRRKEEYILGLLQGDPWEGTVRRKVVKVQSKRAVELMLKSILRWRDMDRFFLEWDNGERSRASVLVAIALLMTTPMRIMRIRWSRTL